MVQRWLFFCRYYRTERIFHDKELSAIIGTLIEDPKKERGGNMQASIQPIFTWSQERILAGGARRILFCSWSGREYRKGEDQLRKTKPESSRPGDRAARYGWNPIVNAHRHATAVQGGSRRRPFAAAEPGQIFISGQRIGTMGLSVYELSAMPAGIA
jgi:hypothetical protein